MVFVNADNNIEPDLVASVKAMETVGSTPNVSILVEMQTMTIPFGTPSDTQAKRLLITKDPNPNAVTSPALELLGDVDSTSPTTISDFVAWAKANFPAQHYALILNDHGGAWTGFGEDDVNHTSMSATKLTQLVAQSGQALGQRFDIFGFDTCLNAAIEVQMLLPPVAQIGIGSEESVPASWDYSQFLADLIAQPTMNGPTLAQSIITRTAAFVKGVDPNEDTEAGNVCFELTAIDLDKLPAVVSAFAQFTSQHLNGITSLMPQLGVARARSLSFWKTNAGANGGEMVDLGDLMTKLSAQGIQDPALAATKAAISAAVLYQTSAALEKNATGISLFWPTADQQGTLNWGSAGDYSTIPFAQQTSWDQYLQAYFNMTTALTQMQNPPVLTSQSSSAASSNAPVQLTFTVDTTNTAVLGQNLSFTTDNTTWSSAGTLDLAPSTTTATWDGTTIALTDGQQTSLLDWSVVQPGSSLYCANAQLSGANVQTNTAVVLLRIDPTGKIASLLGVYYVWPDKVAGTNSFEQAPAGDLAGATLTPMLGAYDANGNSTGQTAATALSATNLSATRATVPAGTYSVALLAMDWATNWGSALANVTAP